MVGGEAGMEASGQAGEACRWRAALGWLGWAGDSADLEMRRLDWCMRGQSRESVTRPIEKSHTTHSFVHAVCG